MRLNIGWIALCALLLPGAATAQDSAPDLYRRSYAAEAKGDIPSALAALDKVSVHDYVFALRRGWLLYLAGRHSDSAAAYGEAIQLEPAAVEPRLGAMLPLMALRRWKEAEGHARDVLARAPGDFTAQSRLAFIDYTQGRYADAEAWYRKTLTAYPASVEMRAGLGWSLLKQNKLREAAAEFSKVLAVAPDHASAKEGRAAIP
jgi:tetratricopeptide (TPR) repeat protein